MRSTYDPSDAASGTRNAKPTRWRNLRGFLFVVAAILLPPTAYGHAGHNWGADSASGLLHPMTGWDHLPTMLALGVWAGFLAGTVIVHAVGAGLGLLLPASSPLARAPVRSKDSE